MSRRHLLLHLSCVALPLCLLAPQRADAIWPKDPGVNLPVCTAGGDQVYPQIVSDGAGGAIITWQDHRTGDDDIRAQHVLDSGAVDPGWPADGLAVCTATNSQYNPQLSSDGAGGAIITWADARLGNSGNRDIYAQHVLVSGVVDAAWPPNGRAVCSAAQDQNGPQLVSDGAGGAIITWTDLRGVAGDIYAQHVLASGVVDAAWAPNGLAVCAATHDQFSPGLISDGAGGAIITWQDQRNTVTFQVNEIYAQHVLASGAVDTGWGPDGVAVCTASGREFSPRLVSDEAGGAIITWTDFRSGVADDIYAQHVLATSYVAWPFGGIAVCSAALNQDYPQIVSDGVGGAIVAWEDSRGASQDIYAQHVLASGAVGDGWDSDGLAICTATNLQSFPQLASDGAGGAIITWYDFRSAADADIYAQHVLASGTVTWPSDGVAISFATLGQSGQQIVSDGAGSAIIVWGDYRAGSSDIYAQGVDSSGRLGLGTPLISSARDIPNDEGGKVKLSWLASSFDMDPDPLVETYWIYRSAPPNESKWAQAGAQRLSAGQGTMPGGLAKLVITASATGTIYWEYVQDADAFHFLDAYSALVPTTGDSLGPGTLNPTTEFMVVALSADSTRYWLSPPASGYSVDNIAPPSPAALQAEPLNENVRIYWNPDSAPDVVSYRAYRGAGADFAPSAENLVASVEAPEVTVRAAGAPVIKISAVDRHGNEGAAATLILGEGTGSGTVPKALLLARPAPNPALAQARIAYALTRKGPVSLQIFDAGGHLVRTLSSGPKDEGEHFIDWNLRSDSGRQVRAGIYFVKLQAEGKTLSNRLTVLH